MRVVVTGGSGFIGTNLVLALANEGHEVTVVDLVKGQESPPSVRFEEVDITDFEALRGIMKETDAVVHLAAWTGVLDCNRYPMRAFADNITGMFDCLEASRLEGVKKFIFASSGSVLAKSFSVYGASKLSGEGLCKAYSDSYNMKVAVLRLGNVYGPYSWHKKSVIPTFIKQALDDEPITVRGNGCQVRSFIHVQDVVDSFMSVLPETERKLEVLHVTSKESYRIIDVAHEISNIYRDIYGTSPLVAFVDKENEADSVKMDTSIVPKVDIVPGLKQTFLWFMSEERWELTDQAKEGILSMGSSIGNLT